MTPRGAFDRPRFTAMSSLEADNMTDTEPVATPLPRLGWRTQAVLNVLLEDPSREVWLYWLDQQPAVCNNSTGNYQVLQRLARAGWLTTRRETGTNARVLYHLTPAGEELAREAVKRSVRKPHPPHPLDRAFFR